MSGHQQGYRESYKQDISEMLSKLWDLTDPKTISFLLKSGMVNTRFRTRFLSRDNVLSIHKYLRDGGSLELTQQIMKNADMSGTSVSYLIFKRQEYIDELSLPIVTTQPFFMSAIRINGLHDRTIEYIVDCAKEAMLSGKFSTQTSGEFLHWLNRDDSVRDTFINLVQESGFIDIDFIDQVASCNLPTLAAYVKLFGRKGLKLMDEDMVPHIKGYSTEAKLTDQPKKYQNLWREVHE